MKRKNDTKIIITTGIPGCGEKDFFLKLVHYCEMRGKSVKIINTGDLMFDNFADLGHKMRHKTILRVEQWRLQTDRSAVLRAALQEIVDNKNKYDLVLVCIHAWFLWDYVYLEACDRFLKKFLTMPELAALVTFIDDYRPIIMRLREREQWQDQKLNPEKILSWQNVEVGTTQIIAGLFDVQFQVFATSQSPSEFYKMVFHPEIESVYTGMPISHLRKADDREPIDRFIKKLSRYFRIVNPLSVEVVGAVHFDKKEPEKYGQAVHRHIVHRDLYWFLHLCDFMVAYWPQVIVPEEVQKAAKHYPNILKEWPRAISSPGLSSEMQQACGEGKDVFTVFLGSEASPFIVRNSTRIFLSEKKFFSYLDKKYPGRKDLVW